MRPSYPTEPGGARTATTIRVTLTDDGRGGADPAGAGLRQRVEALDGVLTITSPPGGANRTAGGVSMRIVIAEDLLLLRDGIVRLLTDTGHTVVAAVDTAPGLIDAVTTHSPDLSIVDVRLPPGSRDEGLRAALQLRGNDPDARVRCT